MDLPHILVVDDDKRLRELLRKYLADNGFRVTVAAHAAEARGRLEGIAFDLIVLDVMMPQMDGLEVLTKLKAAPDTSSIPVILLTAKVQYEDVLGGYKLGADYYITKPFTSTQLVNGINLLLGEGKA